MAVNFNDFFNTSVINAVYKEKKNKAQDKGKSIVNFVNKVTTPTYKTTFDLKVNRQGGIYTPQIIQASNYDVEPTARNFETKLNFVENKPLFRERLSLNEKDRREMLEVLTRDNQEEIESFVAQYLGQVATFMQSVDALNSIMLGQFLTTGTITVSDNGVNKLYDYAIDTTQKEKLVGTAKWDTDTAKPLDDIVRWREIMESKGQSVELVIMTSLVYNKIKNHKSVIEMLNGGNNRVILPSEKDEFIENYTGLKVVLWDESYLGRDGRLEKAFSNKFVTLVPNETLGSFEYSPTPVMTDKQFGRVSDDTDIATLDGTFASLEVETTRKGAGISNINIILSAVVGFNPYIIDKIFIGEVID